MEDGGCSGPHGVTAVPCPILPPCLTPEPCCMPISGLTPALFLELAILTASPVHSSEQCG